MRYWMDTKWVIEEHHFAAPKGTELTKLVFLFLFILLKYFLVQSRTALAKGLWVKNTHSQRNIHTDYIIIMQI